MAKIDLILSHCISELYIPYTQFPTTSGIPVSCPLGPVSPAGVTANGDQLRADPCGSDRDLAEVRQFLTKPEDELMAKALKGITEESSTEPDDPWLTVDPRPGRKSWEKADSSDVCRSGWTRNPKIAKGGTGTGSGSRVPTRRGRPARRGSRPFSISA